MSVSPDGLVVEPLDKRRHDRSCFACGAAALDGYLKNQASQDMRRKANAVFVLVEPSRPARILGYFTLCATALAPGDVPEAAKAHLPRYPLVSAVLIGRLAVASEEQGKGMGGVLLVSALRKAYESADTVGASMVVVDALGELAASFYEAFGFIRLPDSQRLVLPMRTVGQLF